jgi:signal transduction histidine kinase
VSTRAEPVNAGSFRTKLLVGMMLVVSLITAAVLYFAQSKVAADAERAYRVAYESELAATQRVHELRRAALTERCRALVRRPRIHAALEDNALDLLYPSARDELLDVLAPPDEALASTFTLHATFYRFLDANGAVISPPVDEDVGKLSADEKAHLALKQVPGTQQIGYLQRGGAVYEVIAAPIISTETDEVIAAIVLGFKPTVVGEREDGVRSGIWLNDQLFAAGIDASECRAIADEVRGEVESEQSVELKVGGERHRVFFTQLNPDSLFPPAYEVSCFPLAASLAQQRHLRWQVLSVGAVLLLGGLAASHIMSSRFSMPVERLAEDSAMNRAERARAEAELEFTNVELQRSMRFSADASHQLKTPVTVLRAGLEELLQQPDLSAEQREEISRLIFQTSRLSSMIHDLLLLSRVDGGRVELRMDQVDLTQLIDSLADDLSAVPSAPDFDVEVDVPRDLHILGEKRYTAVILGNLLENAWKYNEPGGRIAINAHEDGELLVLTVGNTGPGIPEDAHDKIFERFHRGAVGENVPGHGLGLNLARELARLHGGDLRLVSSTPQWTEFEVRFRLA